MGERIKYVRKSETTVVAVQLDLDTDGFTYRKWEDLQTCKQGDWIVDNGEDTYTVDRATFEATYRRTGRGLYAKVAPVWAEKTDSDGAVRTKEGTTHYRAGAYLVSNDPEGTDSYAVEAAKFHEMYERAPE